MLIFTTNIEGTKNNNKNYVSIVLIDIGASRDFISQTEVIKRKLKTEVLPQKVRIILADGRSTVATQQCQVQFTVNSAKLPVLV